MSYIRILSNIQYLMRNFKIGFILLIIISGKEISAQPSLAAYNSNPLITQHYTCIGINYVQPANSS